MHSVFWEDEREGGRVWQVDECNSFLAFILVVIDFSIDFKLSTVWASVAEFSSLFIFSDKFSYIILSLMR